MTAVLPLAEACNRVTSPFAADDLGLATCPFIAIDCRGPALGAEVEAHMIHALRRVPAVTAAITDPASDAVPDGVRDRASAGVSDELVLACDIVLAAAPTNGTSPVARATVAEPALDAAIDQLAAASAAAPIAAVTFVELLRFTEPLDAPGALLAESLAFSTLLAGPEFGRWLAQRAPAKPITPPRDPVVVAERTGSELTITLNDPERHNAFTAAMRDQLVEALRVASTDASITRVHVQGAGPSFCAGGDVQEFGTTPDPASAHRIRTIRSAALLLHDLGDRLSIDVHGHAIGAGAELAAWSPNLRVFPTASFRLPEVAMGLIPGAGGTASLPRRIGRHRTAWLGLTGQPIGPERAKQWGLAATDHQD